LISLFIIVPVEVSNIIFNENEVANRLTVDKLASRLSAPPLPVPKELAASFKLKLLDEIVTVLLCMDIAPPICSLEALLVNWHSEIVAEL
jgi:hypothetical protein